MNQEVFSFIDRFIYCDEIDSTNLEAKRRIKGGENGSFLVISDSQNAGRGRGKNTWWSGSDSLTFTIVLPQSEGSSMQLIELPLVVGLAVRDVVQSAVPPEFPVQVKWPNDIMVRGRKLCGILCETERSDKGQRSVIIGIGINVNDSTSEAPEEIRNNIISVYDMLGKEIDKSQFLSQVLIKCKENIEELRESGFKGFIEHWNTCDYLAGRFVSVGYANDQTRGRVAGVSENGCLLVANEKGVNVVMSGSVEIL